MSTLKAYIHQQFHTLQLLVVASLFCIVLLTARIKLTHSFFYLFLVWNLFLAVIPYIISSYLVSKLECNRLLLSIGSVLWLAFLPNAPYIITDLWHLRLTSNSIIWLDVLIVFSFASTGLLLFFISVREMKHLLQCYITPRLNSLLFTSLFFLCGFGIYLGRFLRYNSWEIISNPMQLLQDVLAIIINPIAHSKAWLFTLAFGLFLKLGYWMFDSVSKIKNYD